MDTGELIVRILRANDYTQVVFTRGDDWYLASVGDLSGGGETLDIAVARLAEQIEDAEREQT